MAFLFLCFLLRANFQDENRILSACYQVTVEDDNMNQNEYELLRLISKVLYCQCLFVLLKKRWFQNDSYTFITQTFSSPSVR